MDSLLVRGWVFIVIGAITIGIGGVLTTLGWTRLNESNQMRNLIYSVAREWEINNTILFKDPLFNSADEKVLGSHMLNKRLKNSALNNVLTSGLFISTVKKDRTFLRQVADYEDIIKDFNSRLSMTDNFVLATLDPGKIMEHRKIIVTSIGFKEFIDEHMKMKTILNTNYPWAKDATFLN